MNEYTEIEIEKLIPYHNNARTHSEEQVKKIAKSIEEFGFINPVLIDKDNIIIAGHGRVMGAKNLGLVTVPCLRIEHLTEAQKRAYILADNKLAEDAGWDMEMVKIELEALGELDFDISLTGFDLEFDFGDEDEKEIIEDNYTDNIPEEPRAKLGDIYQLGNHRLMCGDSTDPEAVEMLMGGV